MDRFLGCLENQTEEFQVDAISKKSICHDPELGNTVKNMVSLE